MAPKKPCRIAKCSKVLERMRLHESNLQGEGKANYDCGFVVQYGLIKHLPARSIFSLWQRLIQKGSYNENSFLKDVEELNSSPKPETFSTFFNSTPTLNL